MTTTANKTKKQQQTEAILKHGENLNAIFNTGLDPVSLCKKLKRLENKSHYAAECLCNTNTLHLHELNRLTGYDVEQTTEEEEEEFFNKILNSVYKILGEKAREIVFINYDPRGYALKIKDSYIRENNIKIYTDWGGYGILAPEF